MVTNHPAPRDVEVILFSYINEGIVL